MKGYLVKFDETKSAAETAKITLNHYRKYYERHDVAEQISLQVKDSLEWMIANKESYTTNGHLVRDAPWWPMPLVASDDEMLIEVREQSKRDRCYEHGIMNFMFGLSERGILEFSPDTEILSVLTNNTTPKVVYQLIGLHRRRKILNSTITLTKLSEFYCYANGAKNSQVRDRYLVPLAPCGLFKGYVNGNYSIEIGPVGKAFYENVYFPMIKHMTVNNLNTEYYN